MATKRTQQNKSINEKNVNVAELPQRQATGYLSTYSNCVEIGSSPWDIRLLFFEVLEDEIGNLIREKKAHVVMSPQHAMVFSQILRDSLQVWLKQHAPTAAGKISGEETRGN